MEILLSTTPVTVGCLKSRIGTTYIAGCPRGCPAWELAIHRLAPASSSWGSCSHVRSAPSFTLAPARRIHRAKGQTLGYLSAEAGGSSATHVSASHPPKPASQPRTRRKFGPEPPPTPPQPPSENMSAASAGTTAFMMPSGEAEGPSSVKAPKRRGRPPKVETGASISNAMSPPPLVPHPAQSSVAALGPHELTVTLDEAAAAVTAALAAEANTNKGTTSSSSSSKHNTKSGGNVRVQKPFGPELPPPAPPETSLSPLATSQNSNGPALAFNLPNDPSQLNVDDILNLPLPDPSAGQPFRLDGDLSELAAQLNQELGDHLGDATAGLEAAISGGNYGEDVDGDLDYDQLIALASRVNAANYVSRAFERAKQGLDPVPEPKLMEVEVETPPPPPPPPTKQPWDQVTTSSTVTHGGAPTSHVMSDDPSSDPKSVSDAVYVDDEVMDSIAAKGAEGGVEEEAEAVAARRVALLVDLLSASGAELEAKLEAASPVVDPQLLALLERRYTSALKLRQDAATAERIAALYRALRYMYERRVSTPSERLLDDVLSILSDTGLQPNPERRRGEAAARLRNAFTGGMLDVDIFTAAAALAEGRQAAAEALAGEYVSLESFKAEAMGLLDHAMRVQQQTTESLETIETEVARLRREEPAVLDGREWRVRLEQVRLARQALSEREDSISAVQELLLLTRAVEVQVLTGRAEGGA